MVSTASTAAQAGEIERKRKQTLERAKATHLSRQLQMRLQYARLKVEHGWQKQNLNEVENLYFHHSHQRGPKPYPTPSPTLPATHPDTASTSSPPRLSELPHKTWLNTSQYLAPDMSMDTANQEATQRTGTLGTSPSVSARSSAHALPGLHGNTATRSTNIGHTFLLIPQNSITPAQAPTQSFHAPLFQTGIVVQDNSEPSNLTSEKATIVSSNSAESALSTPSLPSQTHLPTSLPFAAGVNNTISTTAFTHKPKKLPGANKGTSLTTKDMSDFNSASLTYDSFWSGLQSKSYPSRTGEASTTAARAGTPVKGITEPSSGVTPSTPNNGRAPATNPNSGFVQQNLQPISASIPPPSLPPTLSHPQSPPIPKSTTSSLALAEAPSHGASPPPPLPPTTSLSEITLLTTSGAQPQSLEMPNLSAWNFASAQLPGGLVLPQDLIPASLLSNPAAFPFFANLSASYLQALSGSGGQAHVANHSGTGIDSAGLGTAGSAGVSSPSTSIPTPTHAPPALSTFVGQHES